MNEWNAHVTVATVVERDGRYLLVEEFDGTRLVINQPAGHLDPGESLVEAAIRETLEETAWQVEIEGLVGLALYTAPGNGVTYHRTTFAGRALSEEAGRALDKDINRTLWLSYEEMQQQSANMRSPLVLKAVEQYRSGALVPLDFIYHP
jgi:ADP-ribose pyrophosphatase YjhB (NUDIX family)